MSLPSLDKRASFREFLFLLSAAALASVAAVGCATGSGATGSCEESSCTMYCQQQDYGWGECLEGACLCHYTPKGQDGGWHPWDHIDGSDECGGCPWGELCCNGSCISVESDPLNCGACNRACSEGEQCVNGWCLCGGVTSCAENIEKCCNGECVNILYDPTNCGDCGIECESETGPECAEGECVCPVIGEPNPTACEGTYEDMCCPRTFLASGGCVDLGNDREHCGSCGHSCDFLNGEICFGGQCVLGQE
jgi:hypothetical protein